MTQRVTVPTKLEHKDVNSAAHVSQNINAQDCADVQEAGAVSYGMTDGIAHSAMLAGQRKLDTKINDSPRMLVQRRQIESIQSKAIQSQTTLGNGNVLAQHAGSMPNKTSQTEEPQTFFQSSGDVAQMAHHASGGPVYMEDGDPTSELIDDNFDETIKGQLTQPTDDGAVEAAVNAGTEIDVVLWRSTSGASAAAIQAANSAGGAAANAAVAAPGHEVQQEQIAVGGVTPEYTADPGVTGFSFRHWLVVIRINTKYLARGSASESGWICSAAAPAQVLDTVDRTLGLPEPAWVGAA